MLWKENQYILKRVLVPIHTMLSQNSSILFESKKMALSINFIKQWVVLSPLPPPPYVLSLPPILSHPLSILFILFLLPLPLLLLLLPVILELLLIILHVWMEAESKRKGHGDRYLKNECMKFVKVILNI